MIYELGASFTNHPSPGEKMTLPTAIGLGIKNRNGQEFLSAHMRVKIVNTSKVRRTQNVPLVLSNQQNIDIRKMLVEQITLTGYRASDFCLVGQLTAIGNDWALAGSFSIVTSVVVAHDGDITTLRVLNRDILYTDGAYWYSGNARLTDLRSGINELEQSLVLGDKPRSGFIGATNSSPGVYVWAPRTAGDKLAADTLAELKRIYPAPKHAGILDRL